MGDVGVCGKGSGLRRQHPVLPPVGQGFGHAAERGVGMHVPGEGPIAAVEALKYDYYKGAQYYRKCDHQSVQSVLIIESKPTDPKNEADVFNVISSEAPDEANLRSCEALGHKA